MTSEERWIQNEIDRIKRKRKRVLNNLEELEKEHVTERVTSILKDRIASYDHEIKLYEQRLPQMVKMVYPLQKDGPVDFMCPACQYGSVLNAYGQPAEFCSFCGQKLNIWVKPEIIKNSNKKMGGSMILR